MNELRIVRGTDIELYVGNTPLFGVTAFSAGEKVNYHKAYEYLNAAPCEYIPQGSRYEIELVVMSLFGNQLPEGGFVLRIGDGEFSYLYHNCRVVEKKTQTKGKDFAAERLVIEADRMEKQVTGNE